MTQIICLLFGLFILPYSSAQLVTTQQALVRFQQLGWLPEPADRPVAGQQLNLTALIRRLQIGNGLPGTGTIDAATSALLRRPHCGIRDSGIDVAAYKLGPTRWRKLSLTYGLRNRSSSPATRAFSDSVIDRAFSIWTGVSSLRFVKVTNPNEEPDIVIHFARRQHGDAYPLDGPGNVAAHAFYPATSTSQPDLAGDIHIDDEENFTDGSPSGVNLLSVLIHEIGHSIGLNHSDVAGSVMNPVISGYQPNPSLSSDDIAGARSLYPITATNVCLPNPCRNGVCSTYVSDNGDTIFRCNCSIGFHGVTCDIPGPGCYSNPCLNGATCTSTGIASFQCRCPAGYSGTRCQISTLPCISRPCLNNGVCRNIDTENFVCRCPENFYGKICQMQSLACDSFPCLNGGFCTSIGLTAYMCTCPSGYAGHRCELIVTPCSSYPCGNHGLCSNIGRTRYQCRCPDAFSGLQCQVRVQICPRVPCQHGATCVESNSYPWYRCLCKVGYAGDRCQISPGCSSSPCLSGGTCLSLENGRYRCLCRVGFRGDRCELTFQQCRTNPCQNGGSCTPVAENYYYCTCRIGIYGHNCQILT